MATKQADFYSSETLTGFVMGLLPNDLMEEINDAAEGDENLAARIEMIEETMAQFPESDPSVVLEEEFLEAAKEFHQKHLSKNETPVRRLQQRRKWISIAASAVLLLGVGFAIYIFNSNSITPMQLAENKISSATLPPLSIQKGDGEDTQEWQLAYLEKNYEAVISLLETNIERSNEESFALGIAFLFSKPPMAARSEAVLSAIQTSEYDKDKINYYLGISQVLQQKNDAARQSFQKSEFKEAQEFRDLLRP